MVDESGSPSAVDPDEEDDQEESGGENRLLGFMFGNVDNSGDLDVDYLDEDAKEHLAALADKLGSSLTDIDLSTKSPPSTADAAEQDYDEKAEDAVDYEDIDEQYEGPETVAFSEEDHLLPKKEFYSSTISLSSLEHKTPLFDDENYDEDEEIEKEEVEAKSFAIQTLSSSDEQGDHPGTVSQYVEDDLGPYSLESEDMAADMTDSQEAKHEVPEDPSFGKSSTALPVLCVEDGMVILRFSEIFCINDPPKKVERRGRRYSTPRDRYTSKDSFNVVEEDEETFIRGSCTGFSSMKQTHSSQEDMSICIDDDSESAMLDVTQGVATTDLRTGERRIDSCLSAEPMKDDVPFIHSLGTGSPKFYPFDQQDWEDMIIWDESPVMSVNSTESGENSEIDSDASVYRETRSDSRPQNFQPELTLESDENENALFMRNTAVVVESIGSRDYSKSIDFLYPERRYHPQLLRLESQLGPDNLKLSDHRKDSVAEEFWKKDTFTRLSKVALRNLNIMEGSWINKIIWDSHKPVAKPKLILDLQDEQMLFEILDSQDGEHLQLHAGAMIINHSSKSSSRDSFELHGHVDRFNISNDKFYSNRKISQQLKSHSKKRTTHGIKVLHSIPALKLQTMKVKLSNKDISNFHRPKALWYPHDNVVVVKEQGEFSSQGAMKIIVKSLGGKGSKLHVDNEETVMSVKTKASKKLDFRSMEPVKVFYSGKELEDHKTLTEQNIQPNALLHLVRTKLHMLPRAQKLPGENKSLRPPGAFKKKSDLSAKDGHVILMEYCEERPLILGNVGMGARLCTYYQKSSASDQTGASLRSENINAGSIHILEPTDKSPFLGDIKPGCKQSSLETNMFRAPVFSHKVSSADYLLIRSAKGKLSVRRIDRIDAVGQQEPHIEVMSPGAKGLQTYIMNRLLVFMYREFRALEQRGPRPSVGADELSSHFPHISEPFLRKRLKHCADLQRKSNGQWFWIMRRNFRIPLEEELRRMVTPEHVCAYESMLAGHHRLRHLGITRLTHPTSISSAMNQLPDEAIALAAASHIERELQITPWNLSSNFVACTNQDRDNIERLEITGVGDPSGRGLGFSYVRTTPKAPVTNAMEKKKTVVSRVGSTVTGTDADLRRLSMEAAREVLLKFNVPDEQISKLTRWHRIAMIRKLSSEQAASGVKVDPTTINKYARGQRMSFLQLQQQTREKCEEIWDRQVQSLSAVDGDENESDSEANSDLDSFAGDLENLLDAEEFEEGDEANLEPNNEKVIGVRGLKMRRHPSQAQAEEEMEDEAAEAAELCKILRDDEAEQKRKKKMRSLEKPGLTPGSQLAFDYENEEGFKKTSMVVNQITSASQSKGLIASKENGLSSKEVDCFNVNRNIFGKVKPLKNLKNDVARWGPFNKKVKIVADGIKNQMIKEKKSAREKFICGACGQLGHMRTNKNCPRYREELETPLDTTDRSNFMDLASQPLQKTMEKKLITKNVSKIDVEGEISNSKAKTLKVISGLTDKVHDVLVPGAAQDFDLPLLSSTYSGTKSSVKVNKIIISNKMKPDDVPVDSHNKPSIIIKPPTHTDKEQLESHRPSIVIRPPTEIDKDQSHKKIIIKRPREFVDLDQGSQDDSPSFEYIKTKKIAELSSNERHRIQESNNQIEDFVRRKGGEDIRYWDEEEVEEEQRENAERLRGERESKIYEDIRAQDGVDKSYQYEIKKYEEAIRREREEEESQKAKKRKNPKKPEMRNEYLENYMPTRRNDIKMPERVRTTKRRTSIESVSYGEEYTPPTKRRRGGEVGLSNILENIVDTLKKNHELSALFQKPVTKKEAPDYLTYVKHPMDLSTIREKVRKMEYKSSEDFRHDVWQIAFNAHVYNDRRNPGIPPLADQLLELCDYILLENKAVLKELEAGIDW